MTKKNRTNINVRTLEKNKKLNSALDRDQAELSFFSFLSACRLSLDKKRRIRPAIKNKRTNEIIIFIYISVDALCSLLCAHSACAYKFHRIDFFPVIFFFCCLVVAAFVFIFNRFTFDLFFFSFEIHFTSFTLQFTTW